MVGTRLKHQSRYIFALLCANAYLIPLSAFQGIWLFCCLVSLAFSYFKFCHVFEQFKQAEDTVNKLDLDGLVVIGGDDSNTNACLLAEYFRLAPNMCNPVLLLLRQFSLVAVDKDLCVLLMLCQL